MDSIVVGLISIFSVVVGALLQNHFSKLANAEKAFSDARNEAYADFLGGVAAASIGTDRAAALLRATDAKTRIAVYGSNAVLQCLADFEKAGSKLQDVDGQKIFLKIIQTMREETKSREIKLSPESIGLVLFGRPKGQ